MECDMFDQAEEFLDNGEGDKAMRLLHMLAGQGRVAAMHAIGHTHLYGRAGIPRDYDIAFKWFSEAAANGCPQGMYHLGMCNAKGYGTPVDPEKALEWYGKSAERGDADAMFEIGNCHLNGVGTAPDPAKAKEWYEKAADCGHAVAAEKLQTLA